MKNSILLLITLLLIDVTTVTSKKERSATKVEAIRRNKRGRQFDNVEPDSSSDTTEQSASTAEADGKDKVSNALTTKSILKKTVRFVKNRPFATIAVAVVLYKCHAQILELLRHLITEEVYDRSTGKTIKRSIRLDKVIQLSLLLYAAKGFLLPKEDEENDASADDDDQSAFKDAFLLRSAGFPQTLFLSNLLKSKSKRNPAYVPLPTQHYTFESLNNRYVKDTWALEKALGHTNFSGRLSNRTKPDHSSTVLVLDWTQLDTQVSSLPILRDQVSFLQSIRYPIHEVVVLLTSPGGAAADYAVAAAQIRRLRTVTDTVTVCVDTVAASGGYMMAVAGTRIFAAPFAVVGSIGVVGQLINIHKLLEGWGVAPLVFRGGTHKAPVGMIGEVTTDATEKVQAMIDVTHRAFQRHVEECRPQTVDYMDKIGNGDVVLGNDAVQLGMVDRVVTSDEYLQERLQEGARVLKLHCVQPGAWLGRPTIAEKGVSLRHFFGQIGARLQRASLAFFESDVFAATRTTSVAAISPVDTTTAGLHS